jgi:hypothetical protein
MDCVSSMKIKVKPTQTLESFVACWQHLNMACPQHDPTNSVVLTPRPQLKQEKSNSGHGHEMIFHVHLFLIFAIHSTIVIESIQGAFQSEKTLLLYYNL